jgi:hypothetical protein
VRGAHDLLADPCRHQPRHLPPLPRVQLRGHLPRGEGEVGLRSGPSGSEREPGRERAPPAVRCWDARMHTIIVHERAGATEPTSASSTIGMIHACPGHAAVVGRGDRAAPHQLAGVRLRVARASISREWRVALEGNNVSNCHPSEGASKNRTQIPIIHRFFFFSSFLTGVKIGYYPTWRASTPRADTDRHAGVEERLARGIREVQPRAALVPHPRVVHLCAREFPCRK